MPKAICACHFLAQEGGKPCGFGILVAVPTKTVPPDDELTRHIQKLHFCLRISHGPLAPRSHIETI